MVRVPAKFDDCGFSIGRKSPNAEDQDLANRRYLPPTRKIDQSNRRWRCRNRTSVSMSICTSVDRGSYYVAFVFLQKRLDSIYQFASKHSGNRRCDR